MTRKLWIYAGVFSVTMLLAWFVDFYDSGEDSGRRLFSFAPEAVEAVEYRLLRPDALPTENAHDKKAAPAPGNKTPPASEDKASSASLERYAFYFRPLLVDGKPVAEAQAEFLRAFPPGENGRKPKLEERAFYIRAPGGEFAASSAIRQAYDDLLAWKDDPEETMPFAALVGKAPQIATRADALARFGLDAPSERLVIRLREGDAATREITISAGRENPGKTRRYVLIEGAGRDDAVYTAATTIFTRLRGPLAGLREKNPLSLPEDMIVGLRGEWQTAAVDQAFWFKPETRATLPERVRLDFAKKRNGEKDPKTGKEKISYLWEHAGGQAVDGVETKKFQSAVRRLTGVRVAKFPEEFAVPPEALAGDFPCRGEVEFLTAGERSVAKLCLGAAFSEPGVGDAKAAKPRKYIAARINGAAFAVDASLAGNWLKL